MTKEGYQEAIELTPAQKKAFKSLQIAIKQCRKSRICFYQCLESLSALNGNNVERITDRDTDPEVPEEASLQYLDYPTVKIECGWADDTHYVVLRRTRN